MATANTTSTTSALHTVARCEFKTSNYVLYRVQSDTRQYDVTVTDGKATGCRQVSGEDCQGWHYRGACKHTRYAEQQEAARMPRRETAQLGANRGFSLMRQ